MRHYRANWAEVVLLAAAGLRDDDDIAERIGMVRASVGKWRKRFAELRLAGIKRDAPRPGRPSPNRQALTVKIREVTRRRPRWRTPRTRARGG